MGKLSKNDNKKCIRYNECSKFSHSSSSRNHILNQNPNDFGFLYYNKSGGYSLIGGTCKYEFDKYSYYDGTNGIIEYLCDDYGHQYDFSSGSYRLIDLYKLIHESDYKSIDLNPTDTIINNCGNWPRIGGSKNTFGGGVNLTYYPTSSDDIYIYLTNGPVDNIDDWSHYDMTHPWVLGGYNGDCMALKNNILRVYSTGNTYDHKNTGGNVNIHIPFNNIGRNSSSRNYSIFYGLNTWVYLYSSNHMFKSTATVQTFNDAHPAKPAMTTYQFGQMTDNIGHSVIGFPIITYAGGAFMVNYYTIRA